MANYSKISVLSQGILRQVDLSTNTLVVDIIKVGGGAGTDLTKTILDRLVSLQNGTDVDATYHTHDGRYFTETELGSSAASSGSDLIGDDNTYSNFTPAAATVKGALSGIDTALGSVSASSALDGTFRIKNTSDQTKQIAFSASAITTGTTRTITMPDANVDLTDVNNAILKDGSRAFTANQPMGSFKLTGLAAGTTAGDSVRYEQAILASGVNAFAADQSFGGFKATNLADPSSNQDAVTLAYLNARIAGIKPKTAVRVATTAAGTLATSFENGDSVDGITLATGDRILIKDQAAPAENGIYVVNASGAPTRATDFDSVTPVDEINGAWVAVQEGTANAGKIFVQFGTVTTVGTDAINFEYWNPIAGLIGGDMITFSSSTFSVDLATTSGLESTNPGNAAGQLRIKLEASNPSLQINGSNELGAKLDAAGAIASGASGLAVQTDNSTIEINTNALRVKDAGITLAKLASNSVDENKIVSTAFNAAGAITGGGGSKLAVQVDNSSIEINTNALRIKSTAYDGTTISGGGGSAASVLSAPALKSSVEIAGESFSATTVYALRYGQNAETAGRSYAADNDATSTDNFYVYGIVKTSGALSAADPIPSVTKAGLITLTSHGFTVGKPVYLGTNGSITSTAPTAANSAVVKVGMVKDANTIDVQIQIIGVN